MAVPTITPEQRAAALERAVEARRARADYKARIKRGEVDFATVLSSDDPIVSRMRVYELLTSLPKIGTVKAKKLMDDCRIVENRRVGGLGDHRKKALMAAYDEVCA
jgi:hypothetical protein